MRMKKYILLDGFSVKVCNWNTSSKTYKGYICCLCVRLLDISGLVWNPDQHISISCWPVVLAPQLLKSKVGNIVSNHIIMLQPRLNCRKTIQSRIIDEDGLDAGSGHRLYWFVIFSGRWGPTLNGRENCDPTHLRHFEGTETTLSSATRCPWETWFWAGEIQEEAWSWWLARIFRSTLAMEFTVDRWNVSE